MCQLIPWHHQQRNTKGYIAHFHCTLPINAIIFIKGKVKFLLAKDNQGMQQVCKLMWVKAGVYRHGHGLGFSNPPPTHTHDAGGYTKYDTVILRSLTHAHTIMLTLRKSHSHPKAHNHALHRSCLHILIAHSQSASWFIRKKSNLL